MKAALGSENGGGGDSSPITLVPTYSEKSYRLRRVFDVVGAGMMGLLLAPLMVLAGVAVRLSGSGPVIFRHERVGEAGALFEMLKFRTMKPGTDARLMSDPEAHRQYVANDFKLASSDPRVTSVGRVLRKLKIDELPQLFNVFGGTMSLVGIRPVVQEQLDLRPANDRQLYILMRPGMTGLWQVEGSVRERRGHRLEIDRRYMSDWSPWLDLKILARTPLAVVRGR